MTDSWADSKKPQQQRQLLTYKNGVPYSQQFDDIYFDAFDPLLERESVYASAMDCVEKPNIIVAEAGFGFGLNFFTTALKALQQNKKLHYFTAEKFPLSREDLGDFYKNFGIFNELFGEFNYEITSNKTRHFELKGGKITLELYFGDASDWLQTQDFKADIWYIDGFSPRKNPELWSTDFIAMVAKHCAPNAILRSYSTARIFKDSLSLAGFTHQKLKGQNKKREFTHAVFMG